MSARDKGGAASAASLNAEYRRLADEYVVSGFDRAIGRKLDCVFGKRRRALYRPVER